MRMAFPWREGMHESIYAKTGLILALFYLNYFFIVPRLLGDRGSWWRFIAVNLLLVCACTWMLHLIDAYTWRQVGGGRHRRFEPDHMQMIMASASRILRDGATLVLTVSLSVVVRLGDKWLELDRRQRELREAARESELQSLRSRLNPHFLFNTLNTIYSLIAIDPEEASRAVLELSSMLRYVTYQNPDRVPVENEIAFIENYVELMKLRMGTRPVSLTVDGRSGCEVAPLLLVGIVENAFKHGNTADSSKPIRIDIRVDRHRIVCHTFNHTDPSGAKDNNSSGVGLPNLRRRLELLYGGRASVALSLDHSANTCDVTLTIPSDDKMHNS